MDLSFIWKTILIILAGTFLLRIAGRKSIAEMALPQVIVMISLGTLIIQPVTGKNIWWTIVTGAVLILTLIVIEYAQMKSDTLENIFTGKAIVLIENGRLHERNLTKTRITVDQLEMNLREKI